MKKILNKLHNFFIPNDKNNHKPHFYSNNSFIALLLLVIVFELAFLVQTLFVFNKTNFLAAVLPGILTSLTNEQRIANQVSPLEENPLLVAAAQLKANDMATKGYFSHNTPDGKTPWYFLDQAGYKYSVAGENLAVNFFESIDVANAWMASPTHRANIVKKEYTEIGIATASGIYEGRSAVFVVQFFGKPLSANSVPVISNSNQNNSSLAVNTDTEINVLGQSQKNTQVEKPKTPDNKITQKTENKLPSTTKTENTNTQANTQVQKEDIVVQTENQNVFKNISSLDNSSWVKLKNKVNLLLVSPDKVINNVLLVLLAMIGFVFLLYTFFSKISHSFVLIRSLVLFTLIFSFMFININLTNKTSKILDQLTSFTAIAL